MDDRCDWSTTTDICVETTDMVKPGCGQRRLRNHTLHRGSDHSHRLRGWYQEHHRTQRLESMMRSIVTSAYSAHERPTIPRIVCPDSCVTADLVAGICAVRCSGDFARCFCHCFNRGFYACIFVGQSFSFASLEISVSIIPLRILRSGSAHA